MDDDRDARMILRSLIYEAVFDWVGVDGGGGGMAVFGGGAPGAAGGGAIAGAAGAFAGRIENRTYVFADTNENMPYAVFVSSKVTKEKKAPLVICLRGAGGNARSLFVNNALQQAEDGGYIMVGVMGYAPMGGFGMDMSNVRGGGGRARGTTTGAAPAASTARRQRGRRRRRQDGGERMAGRR